MTEVRSLLCFLLRPLLQTLALELKEQRNTLTPDVNIPDPDDSPVDSTGNTVEGFLIRLWEIVVLINGSVEDILGRGGINHVLDHETLDGLVLRDETAAVHAVDGLLTAGVHLSTPTVPALLRHFKKGQAKPSPTAVVDFLTDAQVVYFL